MEQQYIYFMDMSHHLSIDTVDTHSVYGMVSRQGPRALETAFVRLSLYDVTVFDMIAFDSSFFFLKMNTIEKQF